MESSGSSCDLTVMQELKKCVYGLLIIYKFLDVSGETPFTSAGHWPNQSVYFLRALCAKSSSEFHTDC